VSEPAAVLFDTNILIDYLNGMAKADHEIRRSHDPAISVITWIEVMTGAANEDEEPVLRAFLSNFLSLPITRCREQKAKEDQAAGCDHSGDG
jgi:predicted nucleic acid-binding protein